MATFMTKGTCAKQIDFEVEDGVLRSVKFTGGCGGNLKGVAKLVEGKKITEVIELLKGIECHNGTSCPDQLTVALEEYLASVSAAE